MAMNTRILEAQLAEAVEDDLRRQNVNSAKLRASSQAVPYEQFKQFVAAANLRPLDKGQDVASIVKARAPGRADATVNIPCFDKPKLRNKTELHAENILRQAHATSRKPAASFAEFEKCWNSIGANAADRVTYLGLHSEAQLAKVFQAAVDFAMMADLLATLAAALRSSSAAATAAASLSAASSASSSAPDAASVESSLAALSVSESASASASASAAPPADQSAAVALRNSAYFVLKSLPLSKRFAFTFSCLGVSEKQHAESIFAALTHSVGAPADCSAAIAFAASDLEALHACYK